MSTKTVLIAIALTLLPGIALAMCGHRQQQQVMSCAEGSVWDSEKQICTPATNS